MNHGAAIGVSRAEPCHGKCDQIVSGLCGGSTKVLMLFEFKFLCVATFFWFTYPQVQLFARQCEGHGRLPWRGSMVS